MTKNSSEMSEFIKLSPAQLVKDIAKLNDQLSLSKIQLSLQKEKNTSVIRRTRKSIARAMTVESQRKN